MFSALFFAIIPEKMLKFNSLSMLTIIAALLCDLATQALDDDTLATMVIALRSSTSPKSGINLEVGAAKKLVFTENGQILT